MLIQNFRTAAKGYGEYCPAKNELRVRKGRKVYRFTCIEYEIRFAAPARPEVVIPIAPDATVRELRRAIPLLIDLHENHQGESLG
jgi:hypothetical protein